MWRIARGDLQGLEDGPAFLRFLDSLDQDPRPEVQGLLRPGAPVLAARAPGRLDVMGGIADYSGARVLQLPLALATWCAVQRRPDHEFRIFSQSPARKRFAALRWPEPGTGRLDVKAVRRWLGSGQDHWCGYVLGILGVWGERLDFAPPYGLDIAIRAEVPEGGGVSSSAALEVAAASALDAAYGVGREPVELALDCQRVENQVVGAACGAMDQLTAACGRAGRLLQLVCQPAEVQGHLDIPDHLGFWGIDSGVRHSVAGTAYASVRVGAFMGHRILVDAVGAKVQQTPSGVRVLGDPWHGYLANVSPRQVGPLLERLPENMAGREFLRRYGGTIDTATRVDPDGDYPVRPATLHPIYEQQRIAQFAALLGEPRPDPRELGELMYESHASYGSCALGSPETDRIVELVREAGPDCGVYGAKITGGGSGGTVAVLARQDAAGAVAGIASAYARESGKQARVYSESSPGCASLGCLELRTD